MFDLFISYGKSSPCGSNFSSKFTLCTWPCHQGCGLIQGITESSQHNGFVLHWPLQYVSFHTRHLLLKTSNHGKKKKKPKLATVRIWQWEVFKTGGRNRGKKNQAIYFKFSTTSNPSLSSIHVFYYLLLVIGSTSIDFYSKWALTGRHGKLFPRPVWQSKIYQSLGFYLIV